MKTQILFILSCLLIYSSCEKETPKTEPVKKSNYQLLTEGKWHMTAATVDPHNMGDSDRLAIYPPCLKDDTLFFKDDSVFILNNGKLKCGSELQETKYIWFLRDDKDIKIGNSFQTIKSLTDKLLITETYQKIDTTNYIFTTTYTNFK